MRSCRPRTVKFYTDYLRAFFKITQTDFTVFWDAEKLEKAYILIHQRPITASTKKKYIIVLQIFSDFLLKKKIIEVNHARELMIPRVQTRLPIALSCDEVEQIRAYIVDIWSETVAERNRMILDTFLHTGLRRSELASLEVRDFMIDRIIVREWKWGKDRVIFLPDQFARRLERWTFEQNLGKKDHLFHSHSGGPLSERTFHTIFSRISKKMWKHIYPHMLRHTYASRCIESGIDIYTLQQQMGHSDITTTSKYIYLNDSARLRTMQKLQ